MDEGNEIVFRHSSGAERIHHNGDGIGCTDGIRDLNLASIGQARCDDVLRHVTRGVRGRTINLGWVFAGKCAAAVSCHTAVRIDDDLATGQPGIAHGAAR